ncbi:MAG TPA: Rne/Rng family ribonuclease [Ignavibacteria bacterium]|nr:Rne/Rng family ribonuclease [Ignavibacteria bacterium]
MSSIKKEILINASSGEIRIAVTEDSKLAEFFVESPDQERNVGDIFLGKVGKVMPGIRAAFIDLGFPQDAFLHFSDTNSYGTLASIDDEDSDIEEDDEDNDNGSSSGSTEDKIRFNPKELKRHQEVIVQVTKEPVGKKGVRVTSKISIPGRYLVLIPFGKKVGMSKKIYQPKEKYRLRKIVRSVLPKGFGVIVRTVAANQDEKLILDDLNKLINEWNKIEEKLKTVKAPEILYKDASTTSSVIRDLLKVDISKLVVDSKKLHKEIRTYIENTSPEYLERLELYTGNQPLFDAFRIEKQLNDSLNKKVWVKGAGYIVIENTEAMTVIDVNSGKYAKEKEQEINSLNTNIESAKEIVRQVRLRDLGGIIVIDFIDLYEEKSRKKLYEELRKEFRKDRAKVTVLPMSEFGLVQITRQRIRQNILKAISDTCPMCAGTGHVQSRSGFITEMERWVQRYKGSGEKLNLVLKVNPFVYDYLTKGIFSRLTKIKFKYLISFKVEVENALALDDFKFYDLKTGKDITANYNE